MQKFYIWQTFQSLKSFVKIFFNLRLEVKSLEDLKIE